jgi:hypothetical protein
MKNQLVHIPELHNNDYSFIEVLAGLCKAKLCEKYTQK